LPPQKLQKATSEFLESLSIEVGVVGLGRHAKQALELARTEPDRPVAGALLIVRFALLAIMNDLDSDHSPETWQRCAAQIEALADYTRKLDLASLAKLAEVSR
jgi:hypothetical protein